MIFISVDIERAQYSSLFQSFSGKPQTISCYTISTNSNFQHANVIILLTVILFTLSLLTINLENLDVPVADYFPFDGKSPLGIRGKNCVASDEL